MKRNESIGKRRVLLLATVYAVTLLLCLRMVLPLAELEEPVDVKIERGMNFRQAAGLLSAEGLIRDEGVFIALGRLTGLHRRLQPGYYRFEGEQSPWDVFMALKKGRILKCEVTIVEGDTLEDIRDKLVSKGVMSAEKFAALAGDEKFRWALGVDAPSLEGYLFPDTYSIPKGMEAEEVLSMMVGRLWGEYDKALRERTREVGFDEKGVLTLASIIEKEATAGWERPIISAVYHNRLKKRIRLQADPTAIYGIKSQKKGIKKSDIRRKTKYNTYFIKGLPPGPIASPGIESIKAALYPASVPYLYFVSNNNGTHTFSVTLAEHLKAVKKYRAARKAAASRAAKGAGRR